MTCKEMSFGSRDKFNYLLCDACGSLSIVEIPKNIENYYSNYPNLNKTFNNLSFLNKIIYNYILSKNNYISKKLCESLNSYQSLSFKSIHPYKLTKKMKILDVGCGNGEFIQHLNCLGYYNSKGIDPFFNPKNTTSNVEQNDILNLNEKFDLIMFHHSFEHIYNFFEVSKKISKLLNTDGLCIIRMPNIESFSFNRFKKHWDGIHAPFHIALPSTKGMNLLFKDSNLQLIEKRWEQPFHLIFYSLNHEIDIADFDELGSRNFFEKGFRSKKIPPLFTKLEFKFWKKKSKLLKKTNMCDYINYYYKKL
jgi:2-polyprenyl-3-methyl-5-hydroxy-6-metoxy-1,4-benzoquinol methylase